MALAPLLALGTGVVLFLVFEVVDALRRWRDFVFLGSLGVAALAQLRILFWRARAGDRLRRHLPRRSRNRALGAPVLERDAPRLADQPRLLPGRNRPFKPEHDALMLSTARRDDAYGRGARPDRLLHRARAALDPALRPVRLPSHAHGERRSRAQVLPPGLPSRARSSSSAPPCSTPPPGRSRSRTWRVWSSPRRSPCPDWPSSPPALFFKVAAFPFHLWAPDVYSGQPDADHGPDGHGARRPPPSGFLIVHLTPILPGNRAAPWSRDSPWSRCWSGTLAALVQADLKRMLAYSSIAHAGTLLLLVAAGMGHRGDPRGRCAPRSTTSVATSSPPPAHSACSRCSSPMGPATPGSTPCAGWRARRPWVAGCLALFMLSLGGIPATAGFLGKWFVFGVLVRQEMITVAVLAVLLSTVALGYYLRVIVVLYMQPPPEEHEPPRSNRWSADSRRSGLRGSRAGNGAPALPVPGTARELRGPREGRPGSRRAGPPGSGHLEVRLFGL